MSENKNKSFYFGLKMSERGRGRDGREGRRRGGGGGEEGDRREGGGEGKGGREGNEEGERERDYAYLPAITTCR